MLERPTDQAVLSAYFDALAAVLDAPSVCASVIGTAPTQRTQAITDTLREGAERIATYSGKWDRYLTKQDFDAKADAEMAHREFTVLSDRASEMLEELRAMYS